MRLFICLLALLVLPAISIAQVCGDVNNSGVVDLADISHLESYLVHFGPQPIGITNADADGRNGVTYSDQVRLLDWLFNGGVTLDCSRSLTYSFTPAPNDTIFLPRSVDIPDGVDTFYLPVVTSFEPGCDAMYVPTLQRGPGSTANFRLAGTTATGLASPWLAPASQVWGEPDTVILNMASVDGVAGRNQYLVMKYVRTAPGVGRIRPTAVDRSTLWRPTIVRNDDMLIPTIVYTDIALPPDSLHASPTSFAFTARAGRPATDTFTLTLTSSGAEVPFDLTILTIPWIKILDYGSGITPWAVRVTADAETLVAGTYNEAITVNSSDPDVVIDPVTIPVTFTVLPPVVFPSGDFNCDGIIDLSDLARMIAYLVLRNPLPAPCL